MGWKGWLLGVAGVLSSAPASAEWLQATSRHFVIYSDTSAADLRALAAKLELFDGAIRRIHRMTDPDDAAANPVTLYVLPDSAAVQRLCGCSDVAGFYLPRATGAVAFTPRRGEGTDSLALKPQTVLFHEYAHHFLLGNSDMALPAWYSEGYAELVGTAQVQPDFVEIGYAANHRSFGLYANHQLSLARLFAPPQRMTDLETDQLYGRGWLLTHYLTFHRERAGQLERYLRSFAAGKPPLEAATEAFGDLKVLDRELARYMRGKLPGLRIPASALPSVPIAVRPLTSGERALIDERMISTRGVDDRAAAAVLARARRAKVPADDALAQGWLAEMAFDAGQDDEAEAAADRALAVDAKSVQALLYKGHVRLRRAHRAKATDPKVWNEARSWIVKANRANTNHAGAFQAFYASYLLQGVPPSASAVAGLRRALELSPQSPDLRAALAWNDLKADRPASARAVLAPLAYAPHAGQDNQARRVIALIDGGASGPAVIETIEREAQAKAKADKK